MAIMSNGPGKRTKTTSKKVTAKDVTSKLQSIFSRGGATGTGKSKSGGAAAGVASRAGGVRTLTTTKVTGSKKAGIEGLKAKKKSGEMSKQEANAKIKALKGKNQPVKDMRGVTVKPKKVISGTTAIERGETIAMTEKMPKLDSAAAMNFIRQSFPKQKANEIIGRMQSQFSGYQKKQPGTRFSEFQITPKGSFKYKRTMPAGTKPGGLKGAYTAEDYKTAQKKK